MQRDEAGRFIRDLEMMKRLSTNGDKLTEIPIRLLYDDPDLNFPTRYACYSGNKCWCSGDGEVAQQLSNDGHYEQVSCNCIRLDPLFKEEPKCKPLGTLQVLLEGVDRVGGVWKFRTTSWNSVNAILSSMALIKTITGGPLAGIPLNMVLTPKTVTIPTTGKPMVAYIVSLEYRGPETKLEQIGFEIAKKRIEHRVRMDRIEDSARKLLLLPHEEPPEEQADTNAEFSYGSLEPEPEDDFPPGPIDDPRLRTATGDGSTVRPEPATASNKSRGANNKTTRTSTAKKETAGPVHTGSATHQGQETAPVPEVNSEPTGMPEMDWAEEEFTPAPPRNQQAAGQQNAGTQNATNPKKLSLF
jgi:hypothetical protein